MVHVMLGKSSNLPCKSKINLNMIPWKGIPLFEKPPFQDSNVVKTLVVSFVLMSCDVIPLTFVAGILNGN